MPLGNVGAGTGGKCCGDVLAVFINCQDYYLCSAFHVAETCRSLESIHERHRNVEYQHIRIKPERCVDRLLSVFNSPDYLEHFAKSYTNLGQHFRVIFGNQYSNGEHN